MTKGALTLAIDFGTTNTVAVARRAGAVPWVVNVDGAPHLPSAVLLGDDGRFVVGTDAVRLGRAAAHRLELRPKARLDEETLLLGDTPIDVVAVVSAVLARVCADAARQAGGPVEHLVLTHPADWGAVRMGRLPRAAAGLAPRLSLVPEPVAVAARAGLPSGAAVVVVDLGGGTCDAAVVRRDGTGFAVLACAGLPDLGGDDLDQRIIDRIRPQEVPERSPDQKAARAGLLLRQDARAAKELLSRHESAMLSTPGGADPVTLTRGEFEALVDDYLRRIVDLARRVVDEAGVATSAMHGVHLVGGTSRIPRIAALLQSALALPVHHDPEPEAGVAWGALELVAAAESTTLTRPIEQPGRHKAEPSLHSRHKSPQRTQRWVAACAALVATATLITAVVLGGARGVDGKPVAASERSPTPSSQAAPDAVPTFPPVRPGTAVVGAGSPAPTVVPRGGTGLFKATGTYEGATETQVDVRLERGEIADRPAPAGYRWVVASIVATLRVGGELLYGDAHAVHLLDDRGQLVDSASRAGVVTVALCGSNQQNLPATPRGQPRTECAVFLVPAATAVRGVVYDDRGVDPLGAHALLFPITLPAAGLAVLPAGEGQVGGPPVEVSTGSGFVEIAIADVIDTPSGYLADPKLPPGSKLHLVRYTAVASGAGTVRLTDITGGLYVLDDRGLLIPTDGFVRYELRNCPTPPEALPAGAAASGCLVFSLSRHATISRVVYQPRLDRDDPSSWRSWRLPT